MKTTDEVIQKIEQIRTEKGITKTHIWKHCGKSAAWYSEMARGKRELYVRDLLKIAEALGEEPKIFFDLKVSVALNKRKRSA